VFIVHETTSKLEMHDLVDPVICRCRKHRQLVCQERGFVPCFPLNIRWFIQRNSQLTIIANGNNLTGAGFTLGETIRFGSLVFTTDRFRNLSLSPKGNDSCAIFVRMVHNGLPSLHTILEDATW
jgi:hypothetical protein